jgi:hypothetical protein
MIAISRSGELSSPGNVSLPPGNSPLVLFYNSKTKQSCRVEFNPVYSMETILTAPARGNFTLLTMFIPLTGHLANPNLHCCLYILHVYTLHILYVYFVLETKLKFLEDRKWVFNFFKSP